MIDLHRTHHIGHVVADIERAQHRLGTDLGLHWAPVRRFDPLRFWTPADGLHEVDVSATYSVGSPTRLELVQGSGGFYDPARAAEARHIGVWTDDLATEIERLLLAGWTVRAAGGAPEEGYGLMAYLQPAETSLLLELISTDLKPAIDDWLGEE